MRHAEAFPIFFHEKILANRVAVIVRRHDLGATILFGLLLSACQSV